MNSRTNIAWEGLAAAALKAAIVVGLCYLILPMGGVWPLLIGVSIFVVSVLISLFVFPGQTNRGNKLLHQDKTDKAIAYYERIYAFYDRHPALDRYRHYVMLNLSAVSFREAAMLGIAFCHTSRGEFARALEQYRATLSEFPQSAIARENIAMLESLIEFGNSEES